MSNKTLSVYEAKTTLQKIIGLLGKKQPYSLLLKTRFGIHTFGMKFSIDVIVLDKLNCVIKLKEDLQPNRIFIWNPKYDTVIELPAGTITSKGIQVTHKVDYDIITS